MLHFCHIFSIENSFLGALGSELDFIQEIDTKKSHFQLNVTVPLELFDTFKFRKLRFRFH